MADGGFFFPAHLLASISVSADANETSSRRRDIMRHFAELPLAPSVALTENERLMKRLHNRMQDAQDAALIIH